MKKNIVMLIMVILMIALFIVGIIINNIDKSDTNQKLNNSVIKENSSIKTESVKSATAYFTVQDCVNKYITYVEQKDTDSILKILNHEYIEKNNITKENVLDKIENIQGLVVFEADKMYVEEIDENNNKYYVSGSIISENAESDNESTVIKDKFYIAVELDLENMIFSVIPLEDGGILNEENN